ncbi:MAG: zinc-ribbon domain-containing protein [Anaerolineae bacterium]
MSAGSLLVGLSLALIVGAWLARPFRRAAPDRVIEYWVREIGAAVRDEPRGEAEWRPEPAEEVNFCPRCGRRVGPEDRFCARCGAPLPRP